MTECENISVLMVRKDLDDLPQHAPPAGYRTRLYRPGDGDTWLRIWRASEPFGSITPQTFENEFGQNLRAMEKRCCFLVAPDGQDIGTATAWYRRYEGRPWGQLHWVGVVPAYQAKGLSRCIVTAAMSRVRALGHRRAILGTSTGRVAAIRTYLRFGFVPAVTDGEQGRAWRLLREHVSHPALARL